MNEDMAPLTPLTPEQQEEFENRRETAIVIQTKCKACGQWYETLKRSQTFKEAFFCDCGQFMQIEVPPLSVSLSAPAIDYSDPDARLDTGMKVREALANASHWWGKTGRHVMRKDGSKGLDVSWSTDPDSPNYVPSGVLNGEPWDVLNTRERLFIVKVWHHEFVRKPQQLGE